MRIQLVLILYYFLVVHFIFSYGLYFSTPKMIPLASNTIQATESNSFSILSWNILAQSLARSEMFMNINKGDLKKNKRLPLIIEVLKDYDADVIGLQEVDILDYIEEKHFQLFMKSLNVIQKALEDEDISLKDKAMISTKYLSLSSGYIMKNINKSSYHEKENKEFSSLYKF